MAFTQSLSIAPFLQFLCPFWSCCWCLCRYAVSLASQVTGSAANLHKTIRTACQLSARAAPSGSCLPCCRANATRELGCIGEKREEKGITAAWNHAELPERQSFSAASFSWMLGNGARKTISVLGLFWVVFFVQMAFGKYS